MNALFCQKAKLGAVDALLNDSLAAKSLNPRPQGQGVTIWLGLRTRGPSGVSASTARRREGAPGLQARRRESPAGATSTKGPSCFIMKRQDKS
jgi:hypothetical protein